MINCYKDSVWYKSLLKELLFLARFAVLYVRNGFKVRTVLFYPEFPLFKTRLNRCLLGTRFNISNNPRLPFDLVVAWEDVTFRPRYPLLERLRATHPVVNIDCTDISKRTVEAVSQEVFGYGLAIDPTTHTGPCVRKDNRNGQHDRSQVLHAPITHTDPDSVYQFLVDNRIEDDLVYDIRLQICAERIAFTYLRYRPASSRFQGDLRVRTCAAGDCLSADEIDKVLTLARRMGLDFGEIDAVRDRNSGRLYVVDVNTTPQLGSRKVDFPHVQRHDCVVRSRAAFRQTFLEPANGEGRKTTAYN